MEIFHHALCFPNPAVTSRRNGASAGPAGAQGRPAAPGAAFPAPAFRCGILSAAEIVNDTLLRIRSKTVEIELFEAEFDVDFFAFR